MDSLLFPDWMMFSGIFLFLKIYSPTRLYLDNVSCVAIAYALVVSSSYSGVKITTSFVWAVSVVVFALFASVPYWLGGMLGSVIQQMLLLNEQSVQDKRFTEETEALSKMGGLISIMYGVKYGVVFFPLLDLFHKSLSSQLDAGFDTLFYLIVDSLRMVLVVSGKYIIVMLVITLCGGYLDLFFKKASLSMTVSPNTKAIIIVLLLNLWLLHDQLYVFKKIVFKMGYEL